MLAFSAKNDIIISNPLSGMTNYVFKGHNAEVRYICRSSDGKIIGSGCTKGIILLWNPENGHI